MNINMSFRNIILLLIVLVFTPYIQGAALRINNTENARKHDIDHNLHARNDDIDVINMDQNQDNKDHKVKDKQNDNVYVNDNKLRNKPLKDKPNENTKNVKDRTVEESRLRKDKPDKDNEKDKPIREEDRLKNKPHEDAEDPRVLDRGLGQGALNAPDGRIQGPLGAGLDDGDEEERMNADEPKDEDHENNLVKPLNAKQVNLDNTKKLDTDETLKDKEMKRKENHKNHGDRLSLDDLQLPDHVDGLRVEHDGHLNRDYKKEILLGEEHREFEDEPGSQKMLSRLKIIFNKADGNHDGYLVKDELEAWILEKVEEHLREAARENNRIFRHLDTDRDGYVTWKEFQTHFLLAQGHNQEKVEEHGEDYESLKLNAADKEKIVRYKFKWAEADLDPQDDRLNRDEMKNFRHPEQSPRLIARMAKDIIENLDDNDDGIITEAEFVSIPRHEDRMHGGGGLEEEDTGIKEERRKEFRNVIDLNRDGKVTEEELKVYVDPHNAQHAQLEAENLIQLADENHDNRLSIHEVLNNAELFFGSKIVNVGINFHDEF